MSGFDDPGIYYSDSFGGDPAADEGQVRKSQLQKRFKEFLRQYRVGTDRTGFTFKYRCGRPPPLRAPPAHSHSAAVRFPPAACSRGPRLALLEPSLPPLLKSSLQENEYLYPCRDPGGS